MKQVLLSMVAIILFGSINAQVGINTTTPTATLHVEGTMRLSNTKGKTLSDEPILATRIVGIDDEGNFVQITTDENLYLENNILKSVDRKKGIGTISPLLAPLIHNLNLIIFPGGSNGGKSIIKIQNILGNTQITGIDVLLLGGPAAADGTTVRLYPVDGDLTLLNNNLLSLPFNRILLDTDIIIKRYGMVQLIYDGTLQRWVVMSTGEN